MIIDRMFLQNDVLGSALQAAVVRDNIISNNIANADVPGFKKKAVKFESYLRDALENGTIDSSLDLNKIQPTVWTENSNYSYRIDGNNVDIESEMVDLYQNSVRYDVMINSVISNYKRLNAVLSGIR